ncbi:CPBP family intramembrane glutamic endopeptidase [Streptococcus sp. DD13]|uniref:CPBP family intramembrane glutamic endopeptidase n=1 Tax=Streptococcus sp. DD13 TaxID=1777881 RepID=UPI000791A787|nr:type II CAAX endopeptidase family protein [Streptococcus sp. DD13]KXT77828.1 CAAX amino terminal protease family protein [Streptococcus sp. DD13]
MVKKTTLISVFALSYIYCFLLDGAVFIQLLFRSSLALFLLYLLLFGLGWYAFQDAIRSSWQQVRKAPKSYLVKIGLGYLFLFLATVSCGILVQILRNTFGITGEGLNNENIQLALNASPVLMLVFGIFVGPAVEELFFRQFLLERLQTNFSKVVSVGIVAAAFAMTHMHSFSLSEWVAAIAYVGAGIVLSMIYLKENNNIFVSYGVHCLNNLIAFLLLLM